MLGRKHGSQILGPFKSNKALNYGTTGWEPISLNKELASLDEQTKNPHSMFSHYKNLISVRNSNEAFDIFSDFIEGPYNEGSSLSYFRESQNQKVLVIHNIEAEPIKLNLKEKIIKNLYMNQATFNQSNLTLNSYGTIILEVQK